jgi:hypothetical protein
LQAEGKKEMISRIDEPMTVAPYYLAYRESMSTDQTFLMREERGQKQKTLWLMTRFSFAGLRNLLTVKEKAEILADSGNNQETIHKNNITEEKKCQTN